jgi:hypothetical protein
VETLTVGAVCRERLHEGPCSDVPIQPRQRISVHVGSAAGEVHRLADDADGAPIDDPLRRLISLHEPMGRFDRWWRRLGPLQPVVRICRRLLQNAPALGEFDLQFPGGLLETRRRNHGLPQLFLLRGRGENCAKTANDGEI